MPTMCRKKIVAFCICMSIAHRAQGDDPEGCTWIGMQEIVKIAYQHRSSLKSLEYFTQSQHRNEYVALSGYLPQAQISSGPATSNVKEDDRNLSVFNCSQLLFSMAGPYQQYKLAKYSTTIAHWEEKAHKDAIRQEVEQAFLDLWNLKQKKGSITALKKSAEHQFAKATGENAVGEYADKDWTDKQATYAEDITRVTWYDHDYQLSLYRAEKTLERRLPELNKNTMSIFIADALQDAQKHGLEFYLDQALLNRKELPSKEQEILQQRYYKKFYECSYIPSVSFFTIMGHGVVFDPMTFWQLGLQFQWTFDGLTNVHQSRVSESTAAEKLLEKINTERTIKLEVQTAYLELQKLREQLVSAQTQLIDNETNFRLKSQQHDLGEISADDFAPAESEWENAQFVVYDLEVQVASKYRELLYRCGYPESIS